MNSDLYPDYFKPYIDKIPEGDPFDLLNHNLKETIKTLAMVSDEQANQAYAEGKWSIKEIIQHLMDSERIFCFRALAFARGEKQKIAGYDHNAYAAESDANNRTLKSLLEELKNVRTATKDLFSSMSDEMLTRVGNANGVSISTHQLLYVIIGHEYHHRQIIEERYL